ncbi:10846_t:CDS:2 [Dentiscutata erythropus]|uniref:10846_t:CDS:1 n=1 Tax=Dentiscutata erythropus TaxID=1348616 RepID=A0A9N9FPB4_9GLOM|nr:10846_t:CDS:2 [Dentiscutata erythropus]
MAYKVPLYIAISEGTICRVIGGTTFFALGCNITVVGLLALVTYLRICKRYNVNLGKYDYRLFLSMILFNIGFTILAVPSLGPAKYWCITGLNPILSLLIITLNCMIFMITVFCYFMTLREINKRQRLIKEYALSAYKVNWMEIMATRKIIGYILIYLMQWTPVVIYIVGLVFNYDRVWTNVIAVITINMGGIANMAAYIINEKWRDDYKSSLDMSPSYPSSKYNTASKDTYNSNNLLTSQIEIEEVITIEIKQDVVSSSPAEEVR